MAAGAPEHGQELLLRRATLEDTTREQQQQIADLVNDLRRAEKTNTEYQKSIKDAELAAQEAQSVAALEIRELKAQLSELQTHEAATRPSSRLYSSVSGIARPAADVSEIARLQELLERETIARARAEADALDLEMRMGDMQRASSHRRPPAEGDSHETADDGDGGVTDLRDQVAHLQKRLAQAEARSDASARESVLEREVRRKNMQLEQQVLALESEVQRLSLQREREEGNKALRDLYEVGVARVPSSEAEQLLQLKAGKEELMAEVDRLKAANAVLTNHLQTRAEELLKKDIQYAAREQQLLSKIQQAEADCVAARKEAEAAQQQLQKKNSADLHTERTKLEEMAEELDIIRAELAKARLAHGNSESSAERAIVELRGERDALLKTCEQLSKDKDNILKSAEEHERREKLRAIQQRDEAMSQLKGSTNMVETLRSQLAEAAGVIVKQRAEQQVHTQSSGLQTVFSQKGMSEELLKAKQDCESLRAELAQRDHDAAMLVEEFSESHNEFAHDVSQILPNLKKLEKSLLKDLGSFAYDMGARGLELPSFPTGALGLQIEPELHMGKAAVSNLELHLDKASEAVVSLDKMFQLPPTSPRTPPKQHIHDTTPLETISTNPISPSTVIEVQDAKQPARIQMLPAFAFSAGSPVAFENVAQAPDVAHQIDTEAFHLLGFANADLDHSMQSESSIPPPPCSPVPSPTGLPNPNAVLESVAVASSNAVSKLPDSKAEIAGSDNQGTGVAELPLRQAEEESERVLQMPEQRIANGGDGGEGGGSGEEEQRAKQGNQGQEENSRPPAHTEAAETEASASLRTPERRPEQSRFSKWAPTHDQHVDKLVSQGFALDPKGDPLHVSPDGVHRPFKPVKEILASRPVRGCLSPLGARQEVPERPESPSSLQFRNDTESGDGTNKSQKKRISFVDEGTVLNSGSHVGQGNVLCLLDPKDQEVRSKSVTMLRPGGFGALPTSCMSVELQDDTEPGDAAAEEQVRVNTEINSGSLYSFC